MSAPHRDESEPLTPTPPPNPNKGKGRATTADLQDQEDEREEEEKRAALQREEEEGIERAQLDAARVRLSEAKIRKIQKVYGPDLKNIRADMEAKRAAADKFLNRIAEFEGMFEDGTMEETDELDLYDLVEREESPDDDDVADEAIDDDSSEPEATTAGAKRKRSESEERDGGDYQPRKRLPKEEWEFEVLDLADGNLYYFLSDPTNFAFSLRLVHSAQARVQVRDSRRHLGV